MVGDWVETAESSNFPTTIEVGCSFHSVGLPTGSASTVAEHSLRHFHVELDRYDPRLFA
jgi:hypothetical protein